MAKKNNNQKSKKTIVPNNKKKKTNESSAGKKNTNATKKRSSDGIEGGDDWLTNLVKVSSTTDSATIQTKAERIEKRNAKKRRRDERKGISQYKATTTQRPSSNNDKDDVDSYQATQMQPLNQRSNSQPSMATKQQRDETKMNLEKLKSDMKEVVASISRKSRVPYQDANAAIKGKATAKSTISNASQIQPRKNDYNGLGMARPSLFLSLFDDSFIPKLEEEFAEHVEGFFGKQRTKAMKKQLDGNMLWRKLLKQKNNQNNSSTTNNSKGKNNIENNNIRIGGKKLSDMTPDERVEAMIKAGMI